LTKILIFGLGNIGFYHLISLLDSKDNFKIDCVEISQSRIDHVKNYLRKLENKKVRIFKSINKIDKKYDFLIHSTNSSNRLKSFQKILSKSKIKYCILEKVLSGNLFDLKKFISLKKKFKKCWVNTFRHETTFWKRLKKNIKFDNISLIEVKNTIGLACNAIHFIDLVASWKNILPISIEVKNFQKWYSSKRKDYFDFYGELEVIFPKNLRVLIRSFEKNGKQEMNIYEKNKKWNVFELDGVAYSKNKKIVGKFELQSEITKKLINKINKHQTCKLPELSFSVNCHNLLVKALLKNWNICMNKFDKKIMIT